MLWLVGLAMLCGGFYGGWQAAQSEDEVEVRPGPLARSEIGSLLLDELAEHGVDGHWGETALRLFAWRLVDIEHELGGDGPYRSRVALGASPDAFTDEADLAALLDRLAQRLRAGDAPRVELWFSKRPRPFVYVRVDGADAAPVSLVTQRPLLDAPTPPRAPHVGVIDVGELLPG